MLNSESDNHKRKAVREYLRKGKNQYGKSLFGQWLKEKASSYYDLNIESAKKKELKNRIKSGIDEKILENDSLNKKREVNNLPFAPLLRIAAGILLIISLGAAFCFFYRNTGNTTDEIATMKEINVPLGVKDTLYLTDGTKVYLNAGAIFTYPRAFHGKQREVYLTGEAFFQVKRMEDCPFIVHSDNVTTTVLGTSFNVKAYPAKMEYQVAVVTGKVLVAAAKNNSLFSKKDETILLPNQQAEISGENFQLKVTNVEIEKVSGWKNGVLVLDQLSIEGIADKLEQWYGLPVKINDEEIRNITFVGRFKNPTLEDVLESIKYTVNINYKIYGSYVLLERVKDKKERN